MKLQYTDLQIQMTEKEPIYYLNDEFMPKSEARVPVMDLGWVRGYGVFDYLITYRGSKPFLLDEHITRLKNSSSLVGIQIPWADQEISELVHETLERNANDYEKATRIVVTGGISEDSITPADTPTMAIFVDNLIPYPGEYYQNGVRVITANHRRFLPGAKSLNYLFAVNTLQEAKRKGAIEAIYVDEEADIVFEGTTSNVFTVKDGQINTPKMDILPGITRKVILRVFNQEIPIIEENLTLRGLFEADEVFLTASNKEVMPVVILDGQQIGNGEVGPITKEVMHKFRNFTLEGTW